MEKIKKMNDLSYEDEDYLLELWLEQERDRKYKQEYWTGGY